MCRTACFAFSALTLLVGHQEEHPACRNLKDRCCRGYLSGARCRWFACGPADATATPSSLASLKSRLIQPFWCLLTQVYRELLLLLQPFYGPLSGTTQVNWYQKKHSPTHLSWSLTFLYQLLLSTRIYSILPLQLTCLTIFLHNLSTSSLVYLLVWSPPPHTPYSTQSASSFRNTCPYQRNLFRCSSNIIPGCPVKEAVKRVSVCLCVCLSESTSSVRCRAVRVAAWVLMPSRPQSPTAMRSQPRLLPSSRDVSINCLHRTVQLLPWSYLGIYLMTFCTSRRWREMYIGHTRLSVYVRVCPSPHSRTTARM